MCTIKLSACLHKPIPIRSEHALFIIDDLYLNIDFEIKKIYFIVFQINTLLFPKSMLHLR